MAKVLLDKIRKTYFKGVKRHAAADLSMKPACYQNFTSGRPTKDWMIAIIRKKYGKANMVGGLTDTQILDALCEEYTDKKLADIMKGYTT